MVRHMRVSIALSAILCTTIAPATAQPAGIIEVTPGSTYRRTTTVIENGVERTTTETGTTPGVITQVGPDVIITTLGSRRVQLENAIAAGQAQGRISAAEAQRLRRELDAVSRAEAASKGTQFTYATALPLALTLDRVGGIVHRALPTVAYVPLVAGGRLVISDTVIIKLDDVIVRRAELESRISWELADGTLRPSDAEKLRQELSRIALVESQMRADGDLSIKDSRDLYIRFDRVGARLDSASRRRR
jgi:hypothetical protein